MKLNHFGIDIKTCLCRKKEKREEGDIDCDSTCNEQTFIESFTILSAKQTKSNQKRKKSVRKREKRSSFIAHFGSCFVITWLIVFSFCFYFMQSCLGNSIPTLPSIVVVIVGSGT